MMSYHPVEYKSKMYSHVYYNEYSETKNNTDSSKCFVFEKHSEYAAKESVTEYFVDKRLSDSQVSKTRLEDNRDNEIRLHGELKIRAECNHEKIIGGIDMVKRIIDFDSEMDKIIDRIVKFGESRTSAVRRVLSYVDNDSNFHNLE